MDYTKPASPEVVLRTSAALKERKFEPLTVATKEEALEKIKELIPEGATLMNGSSRTLEEIGFVDLLKAGGHGWKNLHDAVLAEKDPEKQSLMRRQAVVSDYYLGSVHALSESGELVIASNTGSQLPHLAYTSPNIILVVGAQKIVPTLKDAMERLHTHVIPLENENMMQKYGAGTYLGKTLILHGEGPTSRRKVYIIIVNETLGF